MGKGTKKKTVWRTFSFENGKSNEIDESPANRNVNGQENTPTSNDTNGKPVSNWRYRRFHSNGTKNLSSENESRDGDLQKSNKLNVEQATNTNEYYNNNYGYRNHQNHYHYNRPYYKRWPLSDQQYAKNGFRKFSYENLNSGTGNGTQDENNDNIYNEDDSNRIQSNHYTRSYRTPFHRHFNGGYRRWENRYYHPNSSIGNYYNRGFRGSYFSHSDKQYPAFTKSNDHHHNRNGLTENGIDSHDDHKQNDGSFEHQNGEPDSIKIKEDEYTRISTPRSEVLFKKGYLMRAKKYAESSTPPTTATSSINPPTSSNDSGSVSVVSNEETASYYSIQSMSPENSSFVNCNDGTPISYSNENYNGDVPLVFSSGFYDNNGYFYVNPYVPSHYDQYNRPIGLIPYDNAAPINETCSTLTAVTTAAKHIDDDHLNDFKKQHSINSEDISTSSLSENVSINNDSDTPQSPSTPPPSPLSQSDQIVSDNSTIECAENFNETTANLDEPALSLASDNTEEKTLTETDCLVITKFVDDNEDEPKSTEDIENHSNETDAVESSGETVARGNYSMQYYPPFIFVPPIPFVPGGHMPYQRRNRFHRRYSYHRHNHFRKYNRSFQYNDKFYVPTNWSEAPDETTVNFVQETSAIKNAEPATHVEKSNAVTATPTLEQCDIILKNSKLNSNVSEFIPQTKRNAVTMVTQMVPTSIHMQPIQLNVNVPEFLPKNYKPLVQCQSSDDANNENLKCVEIEDNKLISVEDQTFDQSIAKSQENGEKQNVTNSMKSDNYSQDEQVQKTIDNCARNGSKDSVENNNYNENKSSTVRTLSDLLKTNSNTKTLITNENSFVDHSESSKSISDARCRSKQQNSRMNLKAELGNKHRNKVWYNRNSCADYKNNCNTNNDLTININRNYNYNKTMNNNNNKNNRMMKSAYPAINGHHQHQAELNTDVNHNISNSSSAAGIPTNVQKRNDVKPLSNEGFSYAQMVVPTKLESIQTACSGAPKHKKPVKNLTNATDDKINLKITKIEKNPSIEMKQSSNGSVGWFRVGAKGKKQALPNDKPNLVDFTMKLLQENTSKEEKVNSVAEELQLDIKNDSDLVMDIMDSLAISATKANKNKASNAVQKKKPLISKTSKKKSPKDKMIKESKKRSRSQTFEIIEPNFENGCNQITADVQAIEPEGNQVIDKNSEINYDEEFTFDPNVFTAPLNLKAEIPSENITNATSSCTALRLSANKSICGLMNNFDIYQSDLNVSAENQQLQKAEEMVNKVLEILKKTDTSDDESVSRDTIPTDSSDLMQQIQRNSDDDDDVNSSHSSASSITFEVNAKPYQNAYSSNHFLDRFFGDKDDKRDQVVHSAILSSSDQNNYINTNAEQLNEFDVSNSEFKPNITDPELVQNNDNSNPEYDMVNVVCPVEPSSSEIENLISNKEFDRGIKQSEQAPEAFDDRKPKLGVEFKLTENKKDIETEFSNESSTQLKFSQESGHSIGNLPSNERIDELVVAIKDIEPVVDQQKISNIDSMVKTDELVQNIPKTEKKSNHQIPNKQQPWLCIVDTQMLEKQKKMQNTFPITTAVSMWLNQAQKEKTPEPILRLPNYLHRNGFFGYKRTKKISETSQITATSVGTDQYCHIDNYSSDETASLTSEVDEKDKIDLAGIVDDDEEDDIMNYWELDSQSMLTPHAPPAYQSVYGNSINYEKLLSNKNELLCNNIIDFDDVEETDATNSSQTKAPVNKQDPQTKLGSDENYFKPAPEVCCTIM